jgi:hypothetical protein
VQQVLDWHPFETYTTSDEIDGSGPVLVVTTVFTPTGGGTKVTFYFQCEPEEVWPQLEANIFGTFERAHQNLQAILRE